MSEAPRLTRQDAADRLPEPAVALARRLGPGLITGAADDGTVRSEAAKEDRLPEAASAVSRRIGRGAAPHALLKML